MTYQIITFDHKKKSVSVWFTFDYPANKKDADYVKSAFHYLMTNMSRPEEFYVREVETGNVCSFVKNYDALVSKLEMI